MYFKLFFSVGSMEPVKLFTKCSIADCWGTINLKTCEFSRSFEKL